MKIPVIWIGNPDQTEFDVWWDVTMIKDLLNGELWNPVNGYEFEHHHGIAGLLSSGTHHGGVVVIPARHWVEAEKEAYLKEYLDQMKWRLLIIVGDEESRFDYKSYQNDHTKIWLMSPTLEDEADFYLGSGYAPDARELIKQHKQEYLNKPIDYCFMGQHNNTRRHQATKILTKMTAREDIKGYVYPTQGFTQGLSHEEYFQKMVSAKAVPCPSGIQSPDSFRLYEALESGSVPIADEFSDILVHESGYWQKVFNGQPIAFKTFNDYQNLEGYVVDTAKRDYPGLQNRVFAQWQEYKRFMTYKLQEHVKELYMKDMYYIESHGYHEAKGLNVLRTAAGLEIVEHKVTYSNLRDQITCIIPVSPIPSHPSTEIIEQTIDSIRKQLPDCEIIITFDGVRKEQEHRRQDYEEFIKRLLWKCNTEYTNILPLIFDEHSHQVKMARKALEYIRTPLLLYVEGDCTIRPDREIDWNGIVQCIEDGTANVIRLSHESEVLEPHKHLFLDETPQIINGVPLLRTIQYSQRPHVASVAFYKRMLTDYFSENAVTMIEDKMNTVVETPGKDYGVAGWAQFRIWLYAPGDDYKRSYTTDGRQGDPKWSESYVF